jgi:hypothetical protein
VNITLFCLVSLFFFIVDVQSQNFLKNKSNEMNNLDLILTKLFSISIKARRLLLEIPKQLRRAIVVCCSLLFLYFCLKRLGFNRPDVPNGNKLIYNICLIASFVLQVLCNAIIFFLFFFLCQ